MRSLTMGKTIITRLTDVLIIQLIRTWVDSISGANQGWLAALRGEQIGQALVLIHQEPQLHGKQDPRLHN
ncbi:MAG: hypothetical protein AAGD25_39105 [Cyanobacteria bacterium P01_F01_bin.150]